MKMKKTMFVIAVFTLAILSALYRSRTNVNASTTNREWKKNNNKYGSAKQLKSKSAFIILYVNDKDSSWTEKRKSDMKKKLRHSIEFIKKSAKEYGASPELVADVYDGKEYSDLSYNIKSDISFTDKENDTDKMYKKVKSYINKRVKLQKIRNKYKTDSIGFLVLLNKSGVCHTHVHVASNGKKDFYECSMLFDKYDSKQEGASTYAHEMLHLFGARDLYTVSYGDGITKRFIKYVKKHFPREIMLTTLSKGKVQLKYKITNKVSRITAFFLGWKKNIPEKDRFYLYAPKPRGTWDMSV